MKKKIIFMGTPSFAVPILEFLIENYEVVLVVTKPDKEVGRGQNIKFSPIKQVALKHNIPLFQPASIRKEYEKVLSTPTDIIVTCAFGQIIPKEILEYPKYSCINVHASYLPYLRGGAPIHHAIIDGYKETGVTIMYMNEKMDEGDIISYKKINIENDDNVGTLHDKLSIIGRDLLAETLPLIFENKNERIIQDSSKATYGYNITKEEEQINFNKNASDVYNQIRGLYPFPSGYIKLDNEIIKIAGSYIGKDINGTVGEISNIYKDGIAINCKDKEIVITRLKPEGKKEMSASDYANGKRKENLLGKVIKYEI